MRNFFILLFCRRRSLFFTWKTKWRREGQRCWKSIRGPLHFVRSGAVWSLAVEFSTCLLSFWTGHCINSWVFCCLKLWYGQTSRKALDWQVFFFWRFLVKARRNISRGVNHTSGTSCQTSMHHLRRGLVYIHHYGNVLLHLEQCSLWSNK